MNLTNEINNGIIFSKWFHFHPDVINGYLIQSNHLSINLHKNMILCALVMEDYENLDTKIMNVNDKLIPELMEMFLVEVQNRPNIVYKPHINLENLLLCYQYSYDALNILLTEIAAQNKMKVLFRHYLQTFPPNVWLEVTKIYYS